ncbi:hypothetical protein [Mycolicibacterium diernhoferi]|uniref:Uncharacterized protein n=1 Tax=Mycolicibacterium diernhoferi TaxID=1801 RepID=A0A1Q4HF39_9MYCO|nr:hypothetical protein [Mycolicibacterium diernhoferi]OJZ66137.1 hypothetical protein BRW64_12185 [Mycolicibacterium diernhoferi]OPE53009.1 hypothetical protein BV510_17830 [Mycolicibacterium diernhoferi]PEG51443.1 hypothetical protein CRI78_26695 [Mycolicibacterium diernhoferi]QYL24047.1 hypothetical protein K0O62_07135 [Mycolicibacterium diernhoferi]
MATTLSRRISAAVGGAAILAMIGFTAACSSDSDKPEESPTTTTTTEPSLTPTEKSINPGGGVFTPPVTAPQQTFDPQQND